MGFNEKQLGSLSRYLSDLSKILVASTVIGFFVPTTGITLPVFIFGFVSAMLSLLASIELIK